MLSELSELIEKLIDAKIELARVNQIYSDGAGEKAREELTKEIKYLKRKMDFKVNLL